MPRTARLVLPELPHHLTQRGNNRQDVFFTDDDRELCLRILAERTHLHRIRLVAWCLMSNHIHLVLVPTDPAGLENAFGRTHWRCSQTINLLHGRSGHLWKGRFVSSPTDEAHACAAVRSVERNPVRARIVRAKPSALRGPWSSAPRPTAPATTGAGSSTRPAGAAAIRRTSGGRSSVSPTTRRSPKDSAVPPARAGRSPATCSSPSSRPSSADGSALSRAAGRASRSEMQWVSPAGMTGRTNGGCP